MTAAPPITVIGIGNPYRHDDAAGLVVLAALQARFSDDPRVRMAELDGEPVRLIQTWEGSDVVIIVDAVRSLHPAGTIHRLTPTAVAGAGAEGLSLGGGHLLGLGEAVELASTLGSLPRDLSVVGIEGADFELGVGLSDAVAAACDTAVGELADRLTALLDSPVTA